MLCLRCSSDASWSPWLAALGRAAPGEASWSPPSRCQKGRNHGGSLEYPIFRKYIESKNNVSWLMDDGKVSGWFYHLMDCSAIAWVLHVICKPGKHLRLSHRTEKVIRNGPPVPSDISNIETQEIFIAKCCIHGWFSNMFLASCI